MVHATLGLITDDEAFMLIFLQRDAMDCLHLEDVMFFSNSANLVGTLTTGIEAFHNETLQALLSLSTVGGVSDLTLNRRILICYPKPNHQKGDESLEVPEFISLP